MGKKCIILEHCIHIALIRFQRCHILSIQKNLAGIRLLQTCNDPQCGGFPQPEDPSRVTNSPFFAVRQMLSRMSSPSWKLFFMFFSSNEISDI